MKYSITAMDRPKTEYRLGSQHQRKLNESNIENANVAGISLSWAERGADEVVLDGEGGSTDAATEEGVAEEVRDVTNVEEARWDEDGFELEKGMVEEDPVGGVGEAEALEL